MKRAASLVISGAYKSHPTWVRGLKQHKQVLLPYFSLVASYMGAWIETRAATEFADNVNVASYMGAWIETLEEPQSDEPDIVASYMGA